MEQLADAQTWEAELIAIDMDTRMMTYNLKTRSVETIFKNGTQ